MTSEKRKKTENSRDIEWDLSALDESTDDEWDLSAIEESPKAEWDLSALEDRDQDTISTEGTALDTTILIDTREKKPFLFESYDVTTMRQKLDTGDYSIEGYNDGFAIERKAKDDFLRSISHERERFKEELERAISFDIPMAIVVEAPWVEFRNGNYRRKVPVSSVEGTVKSWKNRYNIEWYFEENRSAAQRKTLELLSEWKEIV